MKIKTDYKIEGHSNDSDHWPMFNDRERRLIRNCINYERNDPAGLPGHNLMVIVAKMAEMLDIK